MASKRLHDTWIAFSTAWKGCTLARWSTTEGAWPFYPSAIQELLRWWQVRVAGLFAATTPPSAGPSEATAPACAPPEALSFKETKSPQKRGLVLRLFCRYSSDAGDQKSRNPNQRSKSRTHTPPAPSPKSGNSQQPPQPEHSTSSLQNSITRDQPPNYADGVDPNISDQQQQQYQLAQCGG